MGEVDRYESQGKLMRGIIMYIENFYDK